ncbi:MAG TPA: hypothetical protein VFM65_05340 [Flavobacteriaceae bacterium]|nr:hypothetical protein [Flavobacteriaceae bacterium]
MKKVVLISVVFLSLLGCLPNDEHTTFTQELVPIVSVSVPDTLVFREDYTFEITYDRPSNCHAFRGFWYEKNENERIIGVINDVYNNPNCQAPEDSLATAELNFEVLRDDFYIFKFWQGEDENGEPIYLTKEVPVKME